MVWEELKWRQLAHHQLMSQQGPHLVHTVKLKPIIKGHLTRKLVNSRISDVAITSVHYEKTRLKKLIIILMNLSQETTVFGGCQKLTSAMKVRPEKCW